MIPPTIQTQTDFDYYSSPFCNFEVITFNYKGDCQYYNTDDLKELTSGILPVVVYPSISPYDKNNSWPSFMFTLNGTGEKPDIDPNKPFNDGEVPDGWMSMSDLINDILQNYNYKHYGSGTLLPQSEYMKDSIKATSKTVSLFCSLYHAFIPKEYLVKIHINDDLDFYIIDVQNGL